MIFGSEQLPLINFSVGQLELYSKPEEKSFDIPSFTDGRVPERHSQGAIESRWSCPASPPYHNQR
jgi:hypothetical protein